MSAQIKLARMGGQGGIGRRTTVRGGDPGLFGTLGKLAGGAIGFVTGGPAGAVAGYKAGGSLGALLEGGSKSKTSSLPMPGTLNFAPVTATPGITGLAQRLVPGGATGYQVAVPAAAGGGCPSGYHANKAPYYLKDGTFIDKGTRCVRNRRRNPMNPRALDRAIGRLNGAKRLQHKLSGYATDKYTATGHRKNRKD